MIPGSKLIEMEGEGHGSHLFANAEYVCSILMNSVKDDNLFNNLGIDNNSVCRKIGQQQGGDIGGAEATTAI